jgi:DNA cross-link repair 1A protein
MFLFEGPFGAVLHTGDCRLTPDCLTALTPPHLARGRIDYLFLDCTFARCALRFPTKEDSIRQVINCVWKHPSAPAVYLVCDMLGQEDVLIGVSRAFGSKIYVDRERNSDCHQTLAHVAPEILADADAAASTRFHVIPFPRLSERATEILALARAAHQPEPLIIRPSSQWYAYYDPPPPEEAAAASQRQQQKPVLTEAMRDEFGVWHVCLSMHSSQDELEQALGILKPKWVVSTTPPCMAVDLSYVRKHCSLSRFGPDDPLWKLLGISDGMSTVTGSPQAVLLTAEAVEKNNQLFSSCVDECASDDGSQVVEDVAEAAVVDFEIRVEPPVTLFGSARFGLPQHEPELWNYEYESVEINGEVQLEANDSAAEPGFCSSTKPIEVVELTEAATKEKNSVSESGICSNRKPVEVVEFTETATKERNSVYDSELLKNTKSDDGVQVVDLTEDGRKEQNLSAETAHCKYDKGNGEAELGAQEQNLNVHARLMEVCRHKVTVEGKDRMEVTKSISAVHVTVSATKDDTIITSSGIEKNSDQYSERESDSSTVVGSSKGLNANLRRLYRSMNVPVPRPLPSLVQLMAASKRPRVSQTVQL